MSDVDECKNFNRIFINDLINQGFQQPTYLYEETLESFEDGERNTRIEYFKRHPFEIAKDYISEGTYSNVCVLNMANDLVPGCEKGNLCRRSSLLLSLDTDQFKPIFEQPLIHYPWKSPKRVFILKE